MPVSPEMKAFSIVILLCCWIISPAATVSGIIRCNSTGEPLSYATVLLLGQNTGVQSNSKGFYNIAISETGENVLQFSLMSYKTQKFTLEFNDLLESRILNVDLEKDAVEIEGSEVREMRVKREFKANTPEIRPGNVLSSAEQILEVSQFGEGDIIRSIQVLPGVSSVSDYSSGLYIWGGTYDQNLILLDDIDVYNPSHFGGIFSTFNTDAISTVELMKGGYPALYGGRMSSVLSINNREGNRKFHQGVAHWSFISAAATLEGPIDKGNSSYMGSFRRSYFDLIAKFMDDIPEYYFYDGHARLNWDVTPTNKYSLSFYNGRDDLTLDIMDQMNISWGNTTFTLMNTRIWENGLFGSFILGGSGFDCKFRIKEEETTLYDWDNSIKDLTFKSRFSRRYSGENRLDWGLEIKYMQVNFKEVSDLQYDPSSLYDIEGRSLINSVYVQDYWQPSPFWNIEPGLRLNYYRLLHVKPEVAPTQECLDLSPRLAIRRIIDHSSNVYIALGRYYQYLVMVSGGINTPMDIWFPIDGSTEPGYCDHYILGYKKEFGSHLALDSDIYYKDYANLVEQNDNAFYSWDNEDSSLSDVLLKGDGYSWGGDILLRTDWHGISGFLGYSLGITRRKMNGSNTNPETGLAEYFYPRYDRTQQLTMMENLHLHDVFDFRLGKGDPSIGLNVTYKTGQPTAKPEMVYFDGDHINILYSYKDRVRLPAYFRIDLSLKWKLNTYWGEVQPYIEAINVTGNKNVNSRNYDVESDEDGKLSIKTEDFTELPFIMMFGVSVKW
ncbi:MAG: TonB-dependent receptor [Candidatus Cloacimonetes bacterium]|nr:TonB-dependent receptor [Candidatus Cloacimonadota bacterium]